MARYIDLDRVIAILDNDIKTGDEKVSISWARSWLNSQPTADVVPSVEAEQLKRNLEECEICYKGQMFILQCKLADEQSKVKKDLTKKED